MNILIPILFLIPLTLHGKSLSDFHRPQITHRSGVLTLPARASDEIQVGHRSLISVQPQKNHVRVVGKKIGSTFVKIGNQKFPIIVAKKNIFKTTQSLQHWLRGRRGLEVQTTPLDVAIHGELLRTSDFAALSHYLKENDQFSFRALISDRFKNQVAAVIRTRLEENHLPLGELAFSPRLQYIVPQSEIPRKQLYEYALRPFGVPVVFNKNVLSQKPLILVQVLIAQVSRRFFRHFGLRWPTHAEGQMTKPLGGPWGSEGQFQVGAHMLEQQGLGQVLASPTLTTKSGFHANFHSGGEYPIVNQNNFATDVQWKKHGILLDIHPRVDPHGRMEIDIKAEISLLNHANGQNGIPAIEKSEVTSSFQWKGQSPIVLSGLLKQSWSKNKEGLPLLSQIPILKYLFSHDAKSKDETDLVFIIQAKVIEP